MARKLKITENEKHNGRIICQGEPAEVYAKNTYYRELIGSEGQGR